MTVCSYGTPYFLSSHFLLAADERDCLINLGTSLRSRRSQAEGGWVELPLAGITQAPGSDKCLLVCIPGEVAVGQFC